MTKKERYDEKMRLLSHHDNLKSFLEMALSANFFWLFKDVADIENFWLQNKK